MLDPADQLNIAAANSLLKTLEEPTPGTLIILVAYNPARLPATIRSRCQQLVFTPPSSDAAQTWVCEKSNAPADQGALALQLAHGAPLKALVYLQDEYLNRRGEWFREFVSMIEGKQNPISLAKAMSGQDLKASLDHLISWVVDLIRLNQAGKLSKIGNSDKEDALQRIAMGLDLAWLYKRYDQLLKSRSLLQTQVNAQLLMEDAMLPWFKSKGGLG